MANKGRSLQDNPAAFALWNSEAAANIKTTLAINMTGLELAQDQMVQLYIMQYPFIASEFVHRDDLQKWAQTVLDDFTEKINDTNKQISDLQSEIQKHQHIGNMGSPTSPSVDSSLSPIKYTKPEVILWEALPEDGDFKHGEKQVTTSSNYTKNINHRNPTSIGTNYSPAIDVTGEFSSAYKFVPSDIGGDKLDTNDSGFINQGL